MIEVNLTSAKKPFRLPTIGGLNLRKLDLKLIVFALIFHHFLTPTISPYLNDNLIKQEQELSILKKNLKKLVIEERATARIREKIDEFKKLEKKLQTRLLAVREIIKTKKNPFKFMYYIAQNTPEDLWLKEISIVDNKIKILGLAESYKSIGRFIESLKESIFFNSSLSLESWETVTDSKSNKRVESFNIKGIIERYY